MLHILRTLLTCFIKEGSQNMKHTLQRVVTGNSCQYPLSFVNTGNKTTPSSTVSTPLVGYHHSHNRLRRWGYPTLRLFGR